MKINKPMAAITTLAGSNGYIIANWYILSISDKAVFPPLNFVFGATAFVALDLAMVAVVFSEPEKDWLGWFLTVSTIATTCAFSGGIAWHLFGDLWHTAFAAAQFMIALHVTHDRKLSHRTRASRVGVEQALQVAVTERDEMEQVLQQAVTERGEMERSLQVAVTEREGIIHALRSTETERDELLRQVERAREEHTEVVTGRADLASQLQRAVTERDEITQALHLAQTERHLAVTSRAELASELQLVVTERNEMEEALHLAQTERDAAVTSRAELTTELQLVVTERDEIQSLMEQVRKEREEPSRLLQKSETDCSEAVQPFDEEPQNVRGELESLSDNQQQMIQIIAENPSANYQQIADVIGVTKASITRYRQNLEQLGLISRNGTWKVHV